MLVQEYVWRLHIEFIMMVSLVCSHQHVKKRRSKTSNIYRVAINNFNTSMLCVDRNYEVEYRNIVVASNVMLEWFSINFIQANPSKF